MNRVSDHEGLTHRHAPGREHNTHLLTETWKIPIHTLTCRRDGKRICSICTQLHMEVCTQMHPHKSASHTLAHTQTPGWHWRAVLFAYLSLAPLILHTATKPALKLGKQKHNKEAKRGQQAASILLLSLCTKCLPSPPWKERDVDRQGEKRKKSGRGEGSQGL